MELANCQAAVIFWSPSGKTKSNRRPSPHEKTPKTSRFSSPLNAQCSSLTTTQRSPQQQLVAHRASLVPAKARRSSPKKKKHNRSKKVNLKSDVHRYFRDVPASKDKSQRSVKVCEFCGHQLVGVAQRLANHIKGSDNADDDAKEIARLHLKIVECPRPPPQEIPSLNASEVDDFNKYFLFALISGNIPCSDSPRC